MKRLVSKFISFILILSMILSLSSVAYAAGELVRYETILDLTGDNMKKAVMSTGNYFYPKFNNVANQALYMRNRKLADGTYNTNVIDDGTGDLVIKEDYYATNNHYMNFYVSAAGGSSTDMTNKKYMVSARFLNHGLLVPEGAPASSSKTIQVGSTKYEMKLNSSTAWEPADDVWYDFKINVDISDNSFVDISFTKDGGTVPDWSKKANLSDTSLKMIQIYMDPQAGGYNYWKEIKVAYTDPHDTLTKASLVKIDGQSPENAIVSDGQKEFKFTLTEEIPDLKPEHIILKYGDVRYDIGSISSSADGDDVEYTAVLSDGTFMTATRYDFEITSDCYDKYRNSDASYSTIGTSDLKGSFTTTLGTLGMMDATAVPSDGDKTEFKIQYVNIVHSGDITFMLAIYDSDGRMVAVYPQTRTGCTHPSEGGYISWLVENSKLAGCSAKIFASKGWGDMSPMFNKVSIPTW